MLPGTDKTFLIVFKFYQFLSSGSMLPVPILTATLILKQTQKPVLASPPIIINHYQCQENES